MADLQPVADKLNPTVRDLADLSPNVRALFRDLNPLIDVSKKNLPDAARFLRGASPVLDGLHNFLQEFNPVLSYLNYDARSITAFLSNGAATANYRFKTDSGNIMHALAQYGILSTERNFGFGASPEHGGQPHPADRARERLPGAVELPDAGKYGDHPELQLDTSAPARRRTSETRTRRATSRARGLGQQAVPDARARPAPNQKAPDDPGVKEAGQPKQYK